MIPETKFAKCGNLHIAYQVVGSGPMDIVLSDFWFTQLEGRWDYPPWARFMNRLAKIGRLIIFDKRGVGLSDRVPPTALPSLEEWMDDMRAVMDAAGSDRAAVIGGFDAGPMAILFAATYPDRSRALVLANTYARFARAPDYPSGAPVSALERGFELTRLKWGMPELLAVGAPSVAGDEEARQWFGRFCRQSASPGAVAAMARLIQQIDVRHVLPAIRLPTLVIHRTDARWIRVGHGRYLAEHIQNAKYVELPGADSSIFAGDQDAILSEIDAFLTGARHEPEADRVLATVLFTDIVGATERAARLGDRSWGVLLERHHAIVRRNLTRFRGREVDTAGDGFFATFDGPARAIRCAMALRDELHPVGIQLRAGLHTGECELIGGKVGGIAVHIGARVMALAGASEILTSSTVKDLVAGSGIEFAERGSHALKGVPGEWRLFAVA